jgi:hypothetical protein
LLPISFRRVFPLEFFNTIGQNLKSFAVANELYRRRESTSCATFREWFLSHSLLFLAFGQLM